MHVNYQENIIQVMNAIRSYIGICVYHEEDIKIKRWLEHHNFQQIVVLLIDGMGMYQLQYACPTGFLRRNLLTSVSTVYPSTTVAATTSILTGKTPYETAWLGWQQYFHEIDENLIMFLNENYYTRKPYFIPSYAYQAVPVKTMIEECHQKNIGAKEIYPAFREGGVHTFQELCERIAFESETQEARLIYGYWDALDSIMHTYGVHTTHSTNMLHEIDERLCNLEGKLSKDTGLLVIADHGHINVTNKLLVEYPDIIECLRILPSLEDRARNFYVKEGMCSLFKQRFEAAFQDSYILYTKQEALDCHLFGFGIQHERLEGFLGDYIACAISDVNIAYDKEHIVRGSHAGLRKEEVEVPVIVYPQ